jgi:large subunit ribosomal protein L1
MKKFGKRIVNARKLVEENKLYTIDQAIEVLGQYSAQFKVKFDEAVDIVLKLGVDAKDTNNMVRGFVPMPYGLGKSVRVAVITNAERVKEASAAGADVFGSEELIEEIKGGRLDFDVCIATPDMMAAVSKVGKILGPKGLIPNPKLGTVTENIAAAVKSAKFGQAEFRIEKAGIIHAAVGKLSFTEEALKGNIKAFYEGVLAAKPASVKNNYMKAIFLSTSQGVSIKLDASSIVG